jgi:hypothetical protein
MLAARRLITSASRAAVPLCRSFGGGGKVQNATAEPGAPGDFPNIMNSGSGLNYEEVMYEQAGFPRFFKEGLYGEFGTLSKPTIVYMNKDHRPVGCKGGQYKEHNLRHELIWMNIHSDGMKHMCEVCAQVFVGVKVDKDAPPTDEVDAPPSVDGTPYNFKTDL